MNKFRRVEEKVNIKGYDDFMIVLFVNIVVDGLGIIYSQKIS
jgi:hypothetical protein